MSDVATLIADATKFAISGKWKCPGCPRTLKVFQVAQKVRAHGRDWGLARALMSSYDLQLEPVTVNDAELAASAWRRGDGLSLADRLCQALGERLEATVLTADTAWGTNGRIRQIR